MAVRQAGELRWKVDLLEPGNESKSASGARQQQLRAWARQVPAKIEDGDGLETAGHAARDGTLPTIVTIRQAGLARRPLKTDAVAFGDRVLNVVSCKDPDQLGRWWELACRESV